MYKHLTGLDHVVLRVADLDRAADDFARMGFTLSPRGVHTLGTENRCLMFGFDYLELLWVPPDVIAPFYAEVPSDDERMTAIAVKTTDAADLHAAWTRAGLAPTPALEFSRPVDVGDGNTEDARFRTMALPAERTPGGRVFACQHLTPGLVWRRGLSRHKNQVTGINKVVIAAEDPATAALEWARVFDIARHPIPGGIAINTGAAPIVILRPDAIDRQMPGLVRPPIGREPAFAAIYLSTGELRTAASVLHAGDFRPVALPDGSLGLGADVAHGIALVFK